MVLRGGTHRGGVGQESLVGAGCRHAGCRLGSLCSLCGLEGSRGGRLLGYLGGLGCLGGVGLLDGLNRGRCGSLLSLLYLLCLLADLHGDLREGGLHGGSEQRLRSLGCGSCAGDVLNDRCESRSGCDQGATEHGGYGNSCERASLNSAGAKCHGVVLVVGVSGA